MTSSLTNIEELLTTHDAVSQGQLIASGEISSAELVETAINRIEALNGTLNAVVTPMYEEALDAARNHSATDGSPLAGVPMLIKDLFAQVANVRLTEGSASLQNYVPAEDSELIRRYRNAGLIMAGKTNTSEFGATPVTESRLLGPAKNPWDLSRTTGGSSGGSAAAVATSMVAIAHGNDGGGSLRIPASCCGVFGFKPSRGRNPLNPEYGDLHIRVICEHIISRSVRDSAAMLDISHGAMPGATYTPPAPDSSYSAALKTAPKQLRIAVTEAPIVDIPVHSDCSSALAGTAELCQQLGHHVEEANPNLAAEDLVKAWFGVWAAGNAWLVYETEHRTDHKAKEEEFEPLTWRYFQQGKDATAMAYLHNLRILDQATAKLAEFLNNYDLWLTPTLAQPPLTLGDFYDPEDDIQRYVRFSPYCRIANLTGVPAMSVPLYWNDQGLPIGTHFSASYGNEKTLFQLARQLEEACPWRDKKPSIPTTL